VLRKLRCGDQYRFSGHTTIVPSTLTRVSEHAFSTADRQAVYRVIAERRDMRRFVPGAVVPDDVLARLLQAAHAAPSVGLMQPWRFIRITDAALRRQIHGLVDEERLQTAHALGSAAMSSLRSRWRHPRVRRTPRRRAWRGQGRPRVRPSHPAHMDLASVSCAIQNLWLAARAEGLGVGWVSIFDPVQLGDCSACPTMRSRWRSCVSAGARVSRRPALEIDRWAFGRPLAEFVSENGWPMTTVGLV